MTSRKITNAAREPVQVYLAEGDRLALARVALVTGLSRAEVLRRGLRRYAAEVLAEESPALAFLADASASTPNISDVSIAENHDQFMADSEIASWGEAAPKVTPRRRKL